MAYEIDFVGSEKVEKDHDATAFRYKRGESFINCVFDGGTAEAGEDLVSHLRDYYITPAKQEIDYVFCSHADLDHASGLTKVLETFKVRNLVMNRPWDYIDELYELVKDGRITKESLEQTLRRKYKFIDELEQLAAKKGCNIVKGVRDSLLESELKIMSPTKDFYIARIAESEKTPKMDLAVENKGFARRVCDALREWIAGIWGIDAIKDGESTSAENETSIILYVKPEGESPFLYTGDAGCMALTEALDYGDAINCKLSECDFVQMPHHGGRHNVGPSILDRLIGPKVGEDVDAKKTSFVSVGKNSDHPRKCVVNAFINRGCRVFVCSTKTLCHHSGQVPDRKWVAASPEKFSEQVEK